MQTIFRSNQDSNFTILANDLINSTMPGNAQKVLIYLLSKPVTWQLKINDLRKQLGLTAYAVKKALRWLLQAGFAAYVRLKSGHTIWRIFDKPQVSPQEKVVYSQVYTPQVEKPHVENQPILVRTETEINKETTTPSIAPTEQESIVVVDDFELIYPEQLNPVQKKAAKAVIKKIKQPELQQPVLFALAYAITSGTVKSPVAYLNGLVTRANNGTFEDVGSTTTTKQERLIPIWKGFSASTPSTPEVASGFIQKMRAVIRGAAI